MIASGRQVSFTRRATRISTFNHIAMPKPLRYCGRWPRLPPEGNLQPRPKRPFRAAQGLIRLRARRHSAGLGSLGAVDAHDLPALLALARRCFAGPAGLH